MLRWLLIITMALLPWHGWADLAIGAGATPAQAAVAAAPAHAAASHHGHEAEVDCMEQHGHPDAARPDASAGDADCSGCVLCHTCSPVALPGIAPAAHATAATQPRPAATGAAFASADRLPGLKPPIS